MTTQTTSTSNAGQSDTDELSQPVLPTGPPFDDNRTGQALAQAADDFEDRPGELAAVATSGAEISTAEASDAQVRSSKLEALWFRLSDPSYVTTALVPVPGVTSADAQRAAAELAKVASSITGGPVHVVTAVGLHPSQALETSRGIASHKGAPLIIVVESPTVDPGSIPIVRNCSRSLLLVGLRTSRGDELSEITDLIGSDRVMGAVCLEPDSKRRWWNRRR